MKFNNSHIYTYDNEINEGMEYFYTEGPLKLKVKVLENNSGEELIAFTLFVIESNRDNMPAGSIFSVDANAKYHNIGYSGMWRLRDIDRFY